MSVIASAERWLAITRSEIDAIVLEAGPAFYLIDLDRLRHNHDALLATFRRHYPRTELAYSVKTNYTPRVLQVIRELGSRAEVVSEMEYRIARRVGFAPEEILVNGPLHRAAFLEEIFTEGVTINLDGWYMLETLDRVRLRHPEKRFRVGLRLHYPVPGTGWSRFGFDTADASMLRIIDWFGERENCEISGLHSHFALAPATVEAFRARIDGQVRIARTWFPGARLDYVDLGGGVGRDPDRLSVDAVAATVAEALEQGFPGDTRPRLVIEPGTGVVADAMAFVCPVIDVKRTAGRTFALVDGSNHNVNTMMWHTNLRPRVLRAREASPVGGPDEVFDVAGNTCMERKDVIATDVPGPVARGDYLVFDAVGAYSFAFKPPFIHPCQAIVARHGSEHRVIKRPETADDVLRTFDF